MLQSYCLPINEDTVKLQNEFSATSCPHRSMELHGNGGEYNGAGTETCRQYFINRIKQLLAGDVTESPVVEKSILDEDVELAKRDQPYNEATVSIDYILESNQLKIARIKNLSQLELE